MKKALLVLLSALPLVGCAMPGEIRDPSGSAGSAAPGSGAAGTTGSAGAGGDAGGGGAGHVGSGGTSGGAGSGTGSDAGAGMGSGAGTSGAGGASCGAGVVPAAVAAVISARCVACHGNPPLAGVPASLTTYAQLTAPSTTEPTKSLVTVALERLQDNAKPMPPAPLARATTAEIAAFQGWIAAGTPKPTCGDGGAPSDAGGGDGGIISDPYGTLPICTSKATWTRGNSGDQKMNPGMACISCHTSMRKGPTFAVAGTLYPTAHEPDLCNGGAATVNARVVIVAANGQTVTLTPNDAGNFRFEGTIAKPYTAKVTYMGRERAMIESQSSGDCNSCHTQTGAMKAPGRILLP